VIGGSGQHQASPWCDHDWPVGASLDGGSLSRCQQRKRHLDGGRTRDLAEWDFRCPARPADRAYAGSAVRPARQVANMPHSAEAIPVLQELLREIKQHLDSDACRDRYTQPRATDHQPSMIRTSSPISKIKRNATDVAAAVVHGEKKSAGQVGELRLCTKSNIETDYQRPHV
jgi:hypothetical protein